MYSIVKQRLLKKKLQLIRTTHLVLIGLENKFNDDVSFLITYSTIGKRKMQGCIQTR